MVLTCDDNRPVEFKGNWGNGRKMIRIDFDRRSGTDLMRRVKSDAFREMK